MSRRLVTVVHHDPATHRIRYQGENRSGVAERAEGCDRETARGRTVWVGRKGVGAVWWTGKAEG